MLKIIYWAIAIILYIAILALMIFMDDVDVDEIIFDNLAESVKDSIKITKFGWIVVFEMVYLLICISWPLSLVLAGILYLGIKRAK